MFDKKVYVICGANCKYEGMTKEQIFAAIAEATGNTPTGIDDAFITRVLETNKNTALSFWKGTEAEFNALPELDENTHYIITDNSYDDIIAAHSKKIAELTNIIDDMQKKAGALLFSGNVKQAVEFIVPNITAYKTFLFTVKNAAMHGCMYTSSDGSKYISLDGSSNEGAEKKTIHGWVEIGNGDKVTIYSLSKTAHSLNAHHYNTDMLGENGIDMNIYGLI